MMMFGALVFIVGSTAACNGIALWPRLAEAGT